MAHSSSFYAQDIPVQLKIPSHPSDAPPLPPRRKTEVHRVPPTQTKHSSSFHEWSERRPIESAPELLLQKPRMRIAPRRPAPPIPPPKPKVMTLQEFASNYSDQLPLSVTAQAEYCGLNSNMQISVGETFSIHLMKTTDVVVATAKGNEKYSIPLNSSCQFSLIYNPHDNMSEALQGYFFNGVMKLASADPLPKVVCPLMAWKKGNLAIETSEILVVRGINSNAELEVFSVASSQTKLLPFDCQSKFTTDPRLLYMYLLDIVDNIPGAFPCLALLQDTNGDRRMFSGSRHLQLIKSLSEATLLCSYPGTNECFDLPVDLPDLTVAICQNNDEISKLQLYESTKHIVSEYNPAYGTCCRDDVAKDVYETQTKIYASIREGYESIGVKLKISQDILKQMEEGAAQNKQEQIEEEGTQELVKPTFVPLQKDIPDGDCIEQVKKTNKNFLSSLSKEMVIDVLHSMGLQQYEGNFQGITGAAMCQLTEEMLECQLGIKRKLHRIRLMEIINGKKNVRSVSKLCAAENKQD